MTDRGREREGEREREGLVAEKLSFVSVSLTRRRRACEARYQRSINPSFIYFEKKKKEFGIIIILFSKNHRVRSISGFDLVSIHHGPSF